MSETKIILCSTWPSSTFCTFHKWAPAEQQTCALLVLLKGELPQVLQKWQLHSAQPRAWTLKCYECFYFPKKMWSLEKIRESEHINQNYQCEDCDRNLKKTQPHKQWSLCKKNHFNPVKNWLVIQTRNCPDCWTYIEIFHGLFYHCNLLTLFCTCNFIDYSHLSHQHQTSAQAFVMLLLIFFLFLFFFPPAPVGWWKAIANRTIQWNVKAIIRGQKQTSKRKHIWFWLL